jgi:hypothetical protein
MSQANANERWTITFRAAGVGPPIEVRIRRLLKIAGRCLDLRAVAVAIEQPAGTRSDTTRTRATK